MQFDFGENWKNYSSKTVDKEKFKEAITSILNLLPENEIKGKSVIDIGCGSGIFSLAFLSLGSRRVLGTDINNKSVEAAKINYKKFGAPGGEINFIVDNILESKLEDNKFNIVYSWGVLHHTGKMNKAIEKSMSLVEKDGYFIIAIYNKHWSSLVWKFIKYIYNVSPKFFKRLIIYVFYPIIFSAKFLVTKENPFKKERGMNFYYDVVDWVGGYPYECTTTEEIIDFFERKGFKLIKLIKSGTPTGCNEFVFKNKF